MNQPPRQQPAQQAWLYDKDGIPMQIENASTLILQDNSVLLNSVAGACISVDTSSKNIIELCKSLIHKTCKPDETEIVSDKIIKEIQDNAKAMQAADMACRVIMSKVSVASDEARTAVDYVQTVCKIDIAPKTKGK